MANELTWHDVLAEEKQQPYFLNTLQTVASERQSGVTIYPPQKDVFNAFRFTELGDVKVVILGQDRSEQHRMGSSLIGIGIRRIYNGLQRKSYRPLRESA